MSGAPTPPIVTEAFGTDAVPPYITVPIPVDSQIPTDPGKASFADGFPPLNMTNPALGGIPPSGADMNGILFTVSAFCAALQGGQLAEHDADASTAFGGYKLGALLAKADGSGYWQNVVDGNTTDPDAGGAGWASSVPLYFTDAPTAGQHDDVVLPGPSDYVYDVDTSAGGVDFSGFVAQRDGQRLYITNTGANLLQLLALTGSAADNQIRVPTDLAAITNQTMTIQYSQGAGKWLLV